MWIKSEKPEFYPINSLYEVASFYYNPVDDTGVIVGIKSNLS